MLALDVLNVIKCGELPHNNTPGFAEGICFLAYLIDHAGKRDVFRAHSARRQ